MQVQSCQLQTPEEGRRTYRPKRTGNNNKDEENSPKTLKDKSHQSLSQKFRQLTVIYLNTVVGLYTVKCKNSFISNN